LLSPLARVRAMAAAIPHCELALIPYVGHAACWEDPAQFNATLLEFCRRVEAAR
jgi:pimeloyl-ACP methyl ester carboxylesterase